MSQSEKKTKFLILILSTISILIIVVLVITISKNYRKLFPSKIKSTTEITTSKQPETLLVTVLEFLPEHSRLSVLSRGGEKIDIQLEFPKHTIITFDTNDKNELIQDILVNTSHKRWLTAFCKDDKARLDYDFDTLGEFRLTKITNIGPSPCRTKRNLY